MTSQHDLAALALKALGIERLVLAIHDLSFPSTPDEDIGRGSPYARGGRAFIAFAHELGFDGIQLGPQGQTSLGNPSPYDGSVFSKSTLSIPLARLDVAQGFMETVVREAPANDRHAHYTYAFRIQRTALTAAAAALRDRTARGDRDAVELTARVAAFTSRSEWLAHDARFEAFASLHETDDWRVWPVSDRQPSADRIAEVERERSAEIAEYELGQYILHEEHRSLREHVGALGVRLYGDLQIGLSLRDRWARGHLFLERYRMGAPPSRTNPEGQPWGYPVFDPRSTEPLAFVRARITKMFGELDGVRIDHPHGLVCPWVYDASDPDPMDAVVHGARLFETPASERHSALAAFAIARAEQIDPSVADYDDDHVHDLDDAQIASYERMFAIVMEAAQEAGRSADDVLCEVLSTCPTPLACVMQRYGLGRFRVTQKASLVDPDDGYRGENAERRDWIMIGNHDTEPLLAVIDRWTRAGTVPARAAYLATRLEPVLARREAFAAALVADPKQLARAMFAELFVGPASNVLVFFADLFGERDTYNTPGLVSDANWRMRVPSRFREIYEERRARGEAMDVLVSLAMAMRARGEAFVRTHADLVAALDARAT